MFVCLGNICRSPYAERVWRARCAGGIEVASAGFIKPGRTPPDTALEVARARGIDHGDHRSRTCGPEILRGVGAVFVFDRSNEASLRAQHGAALPDVFWLADFDPVWAGSRPIKDPWEKPPEEFQRTFARIERCVEDALDALGALRRGGFTGS